jgi:hypothetical protein
MDERLLSDETAPRPDTAPEAISLGEVSTVREDSWREVHRRLHVERESKAEIARQLALDRKTVRTVLRQASQPLAPMGSEWLERQARSLEEGRE